MPKFPKAEMEVLKLADDIKQGLSNNPVIYPNPPFTAAQIAGELGSVIQAHDEAVAKTAAAEQAITLKNDLLAALALKMRDDLRYCEITVNYDDDKLKLVGWGGRAAPTPLKKPHQCTNFHATDEGAGWIEFAWEAPKKGGKVGSYRILSRDHGANAWTIAESSFETSARLENQPQGKSMDYCVVAANKAGKSGESNIVTAVL
jgi:hypothetical protein